jgi:hypothetical protein
MTTEYLLQRFIEHGEKMRNAQKGYYSTPSYKADTKREFLEAAKKAEAEFDNLLYNAKQLVK